MYNFIDAMDWYYNTMVELLKKDTRFANDDTVLLVQDCEDYFTLENSEYTPYKCVCGVTSEIRYIGTKRDILGEIEADLLEYKYGE